MQTLRDIYTANEAIVEINLFPAFLGGGSPLDGGDIRLLLLSRP
jgi:hypothetical protein